MGVDNFLQNLPDDNIHNKSETDKFYLESNSGSLKNGSQNAVFESFFRYSIIPLAFLNRDFNFIKVNDSYCRIFGNTPEYYEGKNYFILYPGHEEELIFQHVIYSGEPYIAFARQLRAAQGISKNTMYWNWNIQPVKDENKEILGIAISLQDVSALEGARTMLAEKIQQLVVANAELQQFAYVASHDLQEPLRMISSFLQLLERRYKDKLDQDGLEFIQYAVDGSKRLQRMITDLLLYSRIESRGEALRRIAAGDVIEQVLKNIRMAVEENQAEITHDSLPTIGADPAQMIQLFQNLLLNSIKFRNPDTNPRIHISAKEENSDWIFSVADNGIGIDRKYFDRIFTIFQRLHGRDFPGSGIGLALCKRIIERHGGKIWLESQPGAGSTFYFSIPSKGDI